MGGNGQAQQSKQAFELLTRCWLQCAACLLNKKCIFFLCEKSFHRHPGNTSVSGLWLACDITSCFFAPVSLGCQLAVTHNEFCDDGIIATTSLQAESVLHQCIWSPLPHNTSLFSHGEQLLSPLIFSLTDRKWVTGRHLTLQPYDTRRVTK